MGKLEVGQCWVWENGQTFKIVAVRGHKYSYAYVIGNPILNKYDLSFKDHDMYVSIGRLSRVTPLMEALL